MKTRHRLLSVGVLMAILLFVTFLQFNPARSVVPSERDQADSSRPGSKRPHPQKTSAALLLRDSDPKGEFLYVFDRDKAAHRFLLSKHQDNKHLPDSDAPAGTDLWLQDKDGNERWVHQSVYRARFSPDGSKIAYTTTECTLRVETLDGEKLAEIEAAYEPNWMPDSKTVLFAQVPEGDDVHMPLTAAIAAFDLATQKMRQLTDGNHDDSRPHSDPAGDWILFVSGSRTGLASFWKVPANGGEPVQVTNVGMADENEQFVPTPYKRTLWSDDKRWFLYDFKNGDEQETWGLEFDAAGNLKKTAKLGEGIDPKWKADGQTFTAYKHQNGTIETMEYSLP